METITFESKLMPNGYLYCPKELVDKKDANFKVVATLDGSGFEAVDYDLDMCAAKDLCEDFLSEEEVNYYINLKEL
jgi:hypothetical protein